MLQNVYLRTIKNNYKTFRSLFLNKIINCLINFEKICYKICWYSNYESKYNKNLNLFFFIYLITKCVNSYLFLYLPILQ